MSEQKTNRDDPGDFGPLPEDELDLLLREWHQINAERAASIHDQLMQQISESNGELIAVSGVKGDVVTGRKPAKITRPLMWRLIMNRYTPIAACLVLFALLIPTLMPTGTPSTYAKDIAMVPEGGRLDALDNEGHILGPCALKHTDVDVDVSGFFTRVTVKQQYHNLYDHKIEAVYTFPLNERAAVDRMKMTIGDRVVIGEVHERNQARAIYEAARQQGYVASLLEQERPNIFTQSLANIEPNTEIAIEISYVELLESKDGTYSFDFPMVVGPRYIPGSPRTSPGDVPTGLTGRHGLILLAPAALTVKEAGDITRLGPLQTDKLEALLHAALPIETPFAGWWNAGSSTNGDTSRSQGQPVLWYRFEAVYGNGAKEFGTLHADGTGQINGRWFYAPPKPIKANGTGFAPDTTQVPDASKITPQPVQPGTRAGHDISIKVTLDTGGPGIVDLKSALHQIVRTEASLRDDGSPRKLTAELRKEAEIPNRDFVLTWRQTADTIQEATFAHTGKNGNFFTLILQPPARVEDAQAVPRELIFVLDTSGSMSGFPIEKAKEVMAKAFDALRPHDTFNLITFSGDEHILWDKPRPFTQANRQEAQNFLASRQGSGGTEMMKAINAALIQTVDQQSERIKPIRICCFMTDGYVGNDMQIIDAIKKNAGTTRVFSFGIGNSVNRYLLDGMAKAGRGEVEYVLLNDGASEKAKRFAQRIQTPVLTDIQVQFSDGLQVTDLIPNQIPDLFDVKPLVLHGRYTKSGTGTLTIRGQTGSGRYERTLPLDLPASQPRHDTIATLWARAKVEGLMNQDLAAAQQGNFPQELKNQVVRLGETFGIMTQFTSFVAVERARVTLGGLAQLVVIPIEMPHGVSYEGVFGEGAARQMAVLQTGDEAKDIKDFANSNVINWAARVTTSGTHGDGVDLFEAPMLFKGGDSDGDAAEGERGRLSSMGAGYQLWSYQQAAPQNPNQQPAAGDGLGFAEVPAENKQHRAYFGLSKGSAAKIAQSISDEKTDRLKVSGAPNAAPASPTVVASPVTLPPPPPATPQAQPTGGPASNPGAESKNLTFTLDIGGDNGDQKRIYADDAQNKLVITADAAHQREITEILTRLESDSHDGLTKTQVIPIKNIPPQDMKRILERVIAHGDFRTDNLGTPVPTTQPTTSVDQRAIPFLRERAVLGIAELVKNGKHDDARKLADDLVKFDASFKIGVQMRDTLVDTKLEPAQRDQRIAALAEEARKPIDAAIRQIELRRRLDERLYRLAATTQPAPPDLTVTDRGVRVTVLASNVEEKTLAALKHAGLNVEATAESLKIVVGLAPRERLAEIAMLDGVRRIEPTKMNN